MMGWTLTFIKLVLSFTESGLRPESDLQTKENTASHGGSCLARGKLSTLAIKGKTPRKKVVARIKKISERSRKAHGVGRSQDKAKLCPSVSSCNRR